MKFVGIRVILCSRKRNLTSTGTFFVVLFHLAAGGATRGRPFLLSAVELKRIRSIVAYLAIS
jgi:hypothetical protein